MRRTRAALLPLIVGVSLLLPPATRAQVDEDPPPPDRTTILALEDNNGVIESIRVEGNQRIETGTVLSYMLVRPGDTFDPDRLDRSLKTLFATGLFADVGLRRDGDTLIVRVVENPIVNRVAFEGDHALTDANLRPDLQLKPRAVFTPAIAQADRQRILDLYAAHGRFAAQVEPKIIRLSHNRVDVVFEITEGPETLISRIAFVGNHEFGEGELREVIESREDRWWRFLGNADQYDPGRIDYDKELLRRFYLKHGYADFSVTNATAELSPDRKAFFVTFTVHEGERYRIAKVSLNVTLPHLDAKTIQPVLDIQPGDWYDGDAVERNVQALTDAVQHSGFAFVEVLPRIARNAKNHTVDLVFDVQEGPRVYVERIDINGNTRTQDSVIRREFRLAEGDAFNAALVRRSRQVLQDLGYFGSVAITQEPGSAADRTVLNTTVEEKSTGELTIGGGYSTDVGPLANIGLRERNLLGTGIDAGVNTVIAQLESQVDLSVTDPYFLGRNIVTGVDLFHVTNNLQNISQYNENRNGLSLRAGYNFSEHLRQSWTYSLVSRNVTNIADTASPYIQQLAGNSSISQIGQTLTVDYRDSTVDPRSGFVVRGGSDLAGLGGTEQFLRTKLDGQYFIPLDSFTGNTDWGVETSAGIGYLFDLGRPESIIDRFFLGGDNLRGFLDGGAGPHVVPGTLPNGQPFFGDSIGGRFIWTQSTELHFPLPVSKDVGMSGRLFVDVGSLSGVRILPGTQVFDDSTPRVSAGPGISWKTPFGLINIDLGAAIVKKRGDQLQLFRIGFGTRF